MNNSIWTNGVELPHFPKLERDLKTDVLIIGGGLAGILCAHRLAQSGVDYTLIEVDRICHGVTRNTTAKITSQHGLIYGKILREFGTEAAKKYWEVNEAAIREYRKLAATVECDFEAKITIFMQLTPSRNWKKSWERWNTWEFLDNSFRK